MNAIARPASEYSEYNIRYLGVIRYLYLSKLVFLICKLVDL